MITTGAIAYLKGDNEGAGIDLPYHDQPVVRPFLPGLHICYLVDQGQSYGYVQNSHLADEKISPELLHEIGLKNLKDLAVKKNYRIQPYGNIFAFFMGGDFEASIVLLDTFWNSEFRKYVKGDYVVAVPSRDVLAFGNSTCAECVNELKQMIDRVWPDGDHLISNKILVRESNQWRMNC